MFELLSKAVVESKQKVNIPKLSKEEPGEKEENEKAKREEERGAALYNVLFISFQMQNVFKKVSVQMEEIIKALSHYKADDE